jgi:GNAT superfamily N-acetyltransferase
MGMLRDFGRRDQPMVRDLILGGMRERWAADFDPCANPDVDDMWGTYVALSGEVLVVEVHGEVRATGTLMPQVDGSGRIMRTAVLPQYRRRGLARMIVTESIDRARRRSLDPVVVATDTPWSDAVALYRARRFELVRQTATATNFSMHLFTRRAP